MRITRHARQQAEAKGFSPRDVYLAAVDPDVTYPSRSHPGQVRCVRSGLCVVIDPVAAVIITVYLHCEETPLRPDQIPTA